MTDKEPIIFNLTEPVDLGIDGKLEKQFELYLYSPSKNDRNIVRRIKQLFMQAITGTARNIEGTPDDNKKDDLELTGSVILQILYSSNIDLKEFFSLFSKLAQNGCVKFVNKVNINSFTYNELSEHDEEKLLGEYLANFTIASLMKELKEI